MESTANTLKTLTDKLFPHHKPNHIIATGGGAKSDLWLEICSKKTDIDIVRSDCPEPATKGAITIS
jgi:sugar (pentulose or hexulose) kinase